MNTTIEKLTMETDSYGAVLAYGHLVLVSKATWTKQQGFGKDARAAIECRPELVTTAPTLFDDAGHAIEWALAHAATITK